MFSRTLASLIAVAAMALSGCGSTYLGRMVSLRDVDVEDHARLPSRAVPIARPGSGLPTRPDPAWMTRQRLMFDGQDLSTPQALDSFLAAHGSTAFLIVADGRLVHERYYGGFRRDSLFKSFSITKSVVSALVGIAAEDGLISRDARLGDLVPGLRDPRVGGIRLGQLMDNVSGLHYTRGFAPWKLQPRMYYEPDSRAFLRSAARAERPAGEVFSAEDLSPMLVTLALETALRRSDSKATVAGYAAQRLWAPMGATYSAIWTIDHETHGLEKGESGFTARAVDFALFGQLYLDGGSANGRQIVPAAWVAQAMTPPAEGSPNHFREGYYRDLWWGATRPNRIRTDVYANGHFGQRIYLSPDRRLVIVRMGASAGDVDWTRFLGAIADGWTSAD